MRTQRNVRLHAHRRLTAIRAAIRSINRVGLADLLPAAQRTLSCVLAVAILCAPGQVLAAKVGNDSAQQAPGRLRTAPHQASSRSANDSRLAALDAVVNSAVDADQIPGAVLLVGQRDRILWRKAYGSRSLLPQREPMTVDTIFDLASLTKCAATTTSMMQLIAQDRKSTRLNSSHPSKSRMPSSA